ncbi:hypothetical protein [Belnapia sp. F-4-1]|uniref:hypothetical protein n=1 Tax=Belnapia sp. F-4-1 TaxID=1545443 RepID=UPI001364C902|nr:hypothetical protein [Belnapia sp. F-4-1]
MSAVQQGARLVLMESLRDELGEPRIAILPPGPRAVPVAFTSMSEALAAIRNLGGRS